MLRWLVGLERCMREGREGIEQSMSERRKSSRRVSSTVYQRGGRAHRGYQAQYFRGEEELTEGIEHSIAASRQSSRRVTSTVLQIGEIVRGVPIEQYCPSYTHNAHLRQSTSAVYDPGLVR